MNRLFASVLAGFAALAASAESVWLECEAFDDSGGWQNDTQCCDDCARDPCL